MFQQRYTLFIIAFFAFLLHQNINLSAQCVIGNSTFKPGEEITYVISYNWFIVWSEVGEVKFKVEETTYKDKPVYHYSATGKTYDSWNWIFPVEDHYRTYVDKETLRPYFFRRDIREGNFRELDSYEFNWDNNSAISNYKVNDHDLKIDTLKVTSCTFDVMSALLFARNMKYDGLQPGDTIHVTVILDKELYYLYFRYQGIENIKVKHVGEFECMKFSVLLIEGTMFHEGENLVLWVTHDKNHIPIYAESPILVGSVKARILNVKGNRYPFTSLKKE